ncbi:MAG: hypothetical protein ACOYK7_11485 [Pirellulales bacterium]
MITPPSIARSASRSRRVAPPPDSLPKRRLAVVVVLLVASSGGCGWWGGNHRQTHPVTGSAEFGGKPAVGAHLIFHSEPEREDRAGLPSAVVKADGTFTVSTYRDGDGAQAGHYVVTAQWFPVGADGAVGVNALHKSFANRAASPLQATIREGHNELPVFRLDPPKKSPAR